ncbi:glycosyltransferase [Altererythrobacter sp. GH1-8]|uniref:glycosyltransferase n=1 Tax=Altererythrobacter sp. GH1-8 TaxID=3349333 RepID=UPI00374DBB26
MTRAAARRWNGANPTGIDRVCDAYADHFGHRAIAVIQIRGRAVMLNRAASDLLMQSLDLPRWQFRRKLVAALTMSTAAPLRALETRDAYYINVGHSDFDLDSHWRWVNRSGLKPIYLLHDLIPITDPDVTTTHKTTRHRGRVKSALKHARGIVANSQTTASGLRQFARDNRIGMPPLLVSWIAGAKLPLIRKPEQSATTKFVSVGTIERRKNPQLLLDVWQEMIALMGEAAPRLVFAGSLGSGSEELLARLEREPWLARFVDLKTDLDDRSLARLISGARAVLLPSFAEGYGIPLVEALERRIPVIGSNLASFEELGQGIPTLLDPHDIQAWAAAVADYCNKGDEYRRQLAAIDGFVAPQWSDHFAKLAAWLNMLDNQPDLHTGINRQKAAFA